jgi:hypothetical protein
MLKFFHDELQKSSAMADLERKLQAFKASTEKQINSGKVGPSSYQGER